MENFDPVSLLLCRYSCVRCRKWCALPNLVGELRSHVHAAAALQLFEVQEEV